MTDNVTKKLSNTNDNEENLVLQNKENTNSEDFQ